MDTLFIVKRPLTLNGRSSLADSSREIQIMLLRTLTKVRREQASSVNSVPNKANKKQKMHPAINLISYLDKSVSSLSGVFHISLSPSRKPTHAQTQLVVRLPGVLITY